MLSVGHPELDAMIGSVVLRVHPISLENTGQIGDWHAHLECLSQDGEWVRRSDLNLKLPINKPHDLLIPGTRVRLVFECDRATKAADWAHEQRQADIE